jgi:hypothetical protein
VAAYNKQSPTGVIKFEISGRFSGHRDCRLIFKLLYNVYKKYDDRTHCKRHGKSKISLRSYGRFATYSGSFWFWKIKFQKGRPDDGREFADHASIDWLLSVYCIKKFKESENEYGNGACPRLTRKILNGKKERISNLVKFMTDQI